MTTYPAVTIVATDPDGDPVTLQKINGVDRTFPYQIVAGNGTLTINEDRTVVYDDTGDTSGHPASGNTSQLVQFTATVTDGTTEVGPQTITINIEGAADVVAPTLVSSTPADNATGVALDASFTLTFSENIQFGTGNVTLYDVTGSATVEAFDVATDVGTGPGTVSITGDTLTIDPTADLTAGNEYAIQIAASAIEDLSGNPFAGISDTTTLSFTTATANVAPVAADFALTLPAGETHLIDTFRSLIVGVASTIRDRSTDPDDSTSAFLPVSPAPSAAIGSVSRIAVGSVMAGILSYTAPGSGIDTITYTVEDTEGATDEGTITVTPEPDNGYNPTPAVFTGDDYIDVNGGFHGSNPTAATFIIRHKTTSSSGIKNYLELYDGANAALLSIWQQGLNVRAQFHAGGSGMVQNNNGHLGSPTTGDNAVGHWVMIGLVIQPTSGGNSEMRMWLRRPDTTGWFDAGATNEFVTTPIPFNSAARHILGNNIAKNRGLRGSVTRFDVYPSAINMADSDVRNLISTAGGQPVNPATMEAALSITPCLSFRQPSDWTGYNGGAGVSGTFA